MGTASYVLYFTDDVLVLSSDPHGWPGNNLAVFEEALTNSLSKCRFASHCHGTLINSLLGANIR